jgi:hypothetical protein
MLLARALFRRHSECQTKMGQPFIVFKSVINQPKQCRMQRMLRCSMLLLKDTEWFGFDAFSFGKRVSKLPFAQ